MTAETMSGTAKVHLGAPWYRHKIILEKPGRGSIIDNHGTSSGINI